MSYSNGVIVTRQVTFYSLQEVELLRTLIKEYAGSLRFDLCFQDFSEELSNLTQMYGPPHGRAYLALLGESPAGCVAIRRLKASICEMKRLYVRPAFRGKRIGHRLIQTAITAGVELGYKHMRLDTVPGMDRAQELYRAFGFCEILSYRHNPILGTQFFECRLGDDRDG